MLGCFLVGENEPLSLRVVRNSSSGTLVLLSDAPNLAQRPRVHHASNPGWFRDAATQFPRPLAWHDCCQDAFDFNVAGSILYNPRTHPSSTHPEVIVLSLRHHVATLTHLPFYQLLFLRHRPGGPSETLFINASGPHLTTLRWTYYNS